MIKYIKQLFCNHMFICDFIYEGGYDDYYDCKCTKCNKKVHFCRHDYEYPMRGKYKFNNKV